MVPINSHGAASLRPHRSPSRFWPCWRSIVEPTRRLRLEVGVGFTGVNVILITRGVVHLVQGRLQVQRHPLLGEQRDRNRGEGVSQGKRPHTHVGPVFVPADHPHNSRRQAYLLSADVGNGLS